MAKLFTTISEVKQYVANDFVKEFDVIKPYLEIAEESITTKYLGQEQFDDIVAFYNNGNPGTDVKKLKLMNYARNIIAYWAMIEYVPIGSVQLSESGIHINSTADSKTAFAWQIENLLKAFNSIAFKSIESMLNFLEANISTFTKWKSSDLYKSLIGLLVNSATIFNDNVFIDNSRMKFIELLPDIHKSEDLFIIPAISQEYFDALIAEVKAVNISTENKIVLEMLRPALCNFAISAYNTRNDKPNTGFENIANKYLLKAIEYLNENASASKYTEYFSSDKYTVPDDYTQTFFENKSDNQIFVT